MGAFDDSITHAAIVKLNGGTLKPLEGPLFDLTIEQLRAAVADITTTFISLSKPAVIDDEWKSDSLIVGSLKALEDEKIFSLAQDFVNEDFSGFRIGCEDTMSRYFPDFAAQKQADHSCNAFLRALFDEAHKTIQAHRELASPEEWDSYTSDDATWNRFQENVISEARRQLLFLSPCLNLSDNDASSLAASAKSSLQNLRKLVQAPIIVAFDDVDVVDEVVDDVGRQTILALHEAFKGLSIEDKSIASAVISSRITVIPFIFHSIGRTPDYMRPFTQTSLDVFSSSLPTNTEFSLKQIRSIDSASYIGRPIWRFHLAQGLPIYQLLDLAEQKLNGKLVGFKNRPVAAFAPVACRPFVQCANRNWLNGLVGDHLAYVYFVNPRFKEAEIWYPPEPLVSAAAARIMVKDLREYPQYHPRWLDALEKAAVDRNISTIDGEGLMARIIYTLARDHAYIRQYPRTPTPCSKVDTVAGHEPVLLSFFLEALFGSDAWETIKHATPLNRSSTNRTLQEFIEHAVIDFTLDGMISALRQGCAVVCHANQLYDHVIVFVLDPEQPITAGNVGLVASNLRRTCALNASPFTIQNDSPVVPIITIATSEITQTSVDSPSSQEVNHPPVTHPHYQLHLRTIPFLNSATYRAILGGQIPLDAYQNALNRREIGCLCSSPNGICASKSVSWISKIVVTCKASVNGMS
ncbi:hypothetical protein ONZ45_g2818 [Pleurotus djamor]|nr:hypothetical protein ONZ45_g2818 [Pleurotus djamor]